FHEVLLEACEIRRLREIAASLRDASELYRRWSRHLGSEDRRDIPGEHQQLLQAALARRVADACALLTQHIQFTTNAILAEGKLSADIEAGHVGSGSGGSDESTAAGGRARRST